MGYIIKPSAGAGNVSSGTWIPTLNFQGSACASITFAKAYYTKVDKIVTCTILANGQFNYSASEFTGFFDFSVPLPTTTLNPIGVGQLSGNANNCNIACFSASTVYCRYFCFSNGLTAFNSNFCLSFQYEIN